MSRLRTPNLDSTLVQAPLLPELEDHALMRATYFFLYVFNLQFLVDYINEKHAPSPRLRSLDGYLHKATHQASSGFRRGDHPHFQEFDRTRVDPRTATTAGFTNTDAAHYCNLGLDPQLFQTVSDFVHDRPVYEVYSLLNEFICPDTTHLPREVNLGTDRVVDGLHADLAPLLFNKTTAPLITRDEIRLYQSRAIQRMTVYAADQGKRGDHGMVQCANAYLEAYNHPEFAGTVLARVLEDAQHRCRLAGNLLPASKYVRWN